ncbi:RsiW-degrading membrane proteinase PrsW (M82 family) [Pullulanibacillus pueri]|uniref:Protease PrsW n=1 Tax=Pullulanibacillus pueri TaxID=1437324 RepID=A0A8J2ZUK9_9BACL|nr:glutamic-type intramembrane protease PrsW [Pullulanibacillus pueri]MBM7681486.1 RsiW-degrading membrane proteinase PrsW (M82 family) [Pullulanibacillus pueri]GGH79072.1 protease PrsW [Pullulanibacillus pueri]
MLAIITAGIAPGIAFLSYIYLKDKYESEPIGVVIKTFIIGALLVLPVMMIQYAFSAEHLLQGRLAQAFLLNGLLEEFLKWFIVIYTAYHHVAFSERYDGIVYTAAVSLGFATAENVFYLFAYGIDVALWRALLPVASHGLFGIIMGYYIGRAKFSRNKVKWLSLALFIAVVLHGVYDVFMNFRTLWLYAIVPFMLFLWWYALRKVKQTYKDQENWYKNSGPERPTINGPF